MFESITAYVNIIIGLLFSYVLSRFEQRRRNTKISGTIIFYYLLICLFKRIPTDSDSVATHFHLNPTMVGIGIMGLVGLGLLAAKKLFTHFFDKEVTLK